MGKCTVIAEVAQAHDGSLGTAHAYIDAAADAGADVIKFQCHIARAESTPAEPWRVQFSRQDATRYEYWQRMEFTEEQWLGLKEHCDERQIEFLCSPFSVEAVELLHRVGVRRWKLASGEVFSQDILDAIAATGLPVIASTGMVSWSDIDHMVNSLRSKGIAFALLQCTTAYPCPPEKVGLNVMKELRERYQCPVGLSDHSGDIFAGLAAASMGADFLEVHIAFSKKSFGPDVQASLTIEQLDQLVKGVRAIEAMLAHPVDKNEAAATMAPMRKLFMKSVVAKEPIARGAELTRELLIAKKPGTGIPSTEIEKVVGKRATKDLPADHLLEYSDFE